MCSHNRHCNAKQMFFETATTGYLPVHLILCYCSKEARDRMHDVIYSLRHRLNLLVSRASPSHEKYFLCEGLVREVLRGGASVSDDRKFTSSP